MGKGDGRRPTLITDAEFAKSWCATMGHKMVELMDWCANCGKSVLEIEQDSAQAARQAIREAEAFDLFNKEMEQLTGPGDINNTRPEGSA